MNLSKKYFIFSFLIFPVVFIPLFMTLEFRFVDPDKFAHKLVKAFNKEDIPILIFGDSVVSSTGICETNRTTQDILFAEAFSKKSFVINSPGYGPIIYNDYINLLQTTKYRPEVIIFGINLRIFSDDWAVRPPNQWTLRRMYINSLSEGPQYIFKNFTTFFSYRFLDKENIDNQAWREHVVNYDGTPLGSVRDLYQNFRVPAIFECKPDGVDYSKQLALRFNFHYMYRLTADHPYLQLLNEIKNKLDKMNIKLFIYIMPIDYQTGSKVIGKSFDSNLANTISVIENSLNQFKTPFINLAYTQGTENFIDRHDACEHLNFFGRKFVAEQVAKNLK